MSWQGHGCRERVAQGSPGGTEAWRQGKGGCGDMSQGPLETSHPPKVQLLLGAKVNTGHVPSQGQLQRPVPPGRHRCCRHLPLLCQAAFTCWEKKNTHK